MPVLRQGDDCFRGGGFPEGVFPWFVLSYTNSGTFLEKPRTNYLKRQVYVEFNLVGFIETGWS